LSDTSGINTDALRMQYNLITASARIESNYKPKEGIHHALGFRYNRLENSGASNENNVLADGLVGKNSGRWYMELKGSVNYASTVNLAGRADNSVAQFTPAITYKKDDAYWIKAGTNVAMANASSVRIRIFPHIDASYRITGDHLVAFAGANGGIARNTAVGFVQSNPFIYDSVRYVNTTTRFEAQGGFKGSFGNEWMYLAKVHFRQLSDAPLFVNTADRLQNKFLVVYENMEVIEATIGLGWMIRNKISLDVKGSYFQYGRLENELHPWHLPQFQASGECRWKVTEKWSINSLVAVIGQRFAKAREGEAVKLPVFVDASIGCSWNYSSNLSFFANFNNLTARSYQIWNRFPSQRLNFMGGLAYSF
jgi:hypothetical protein